MKTKRDLVCFKVQWELHDFNSGAFPFINESFSTTFPYIRCPSLHFCRKSSLLVYTIQTQVHRTIRIDSATLMLSFQRSQNEKWTTTIKTTKKISSDEEKASHLCGFTNAAFNMQVNTNKKDKTKLYHCVYIFIFTFPSF